jgi:hypothetical protein
MNKINKSKKHFEFYGDYDPRTAFRGVNFTNILREFFSVQTSNEQLFCTSSLGLNIFGARKWQKAVLKMFVKLTTGIVKGQKDRKENFT